MKKLDRFRDWLTMFSNGDQQSRIYVFGDSHTAALLRAQSFGERAANYDNIVISRLRKAKAGQMIGDESVEQFCQKIKRLKPTDFVFSAIGGNQYAVVSTIRHESDFSVLDAGVVLDQAGNDLMPIIPRRAFKSYISSGVWNSDGPVIRKIKSSTRGRVFHLSPPPPKFDNKFLVKNHETRFAEAGLAELEPTEPAFRLACWEMQQECLAALCVNAGVELVPPPASTLTEKGFLAPLYYSKDVTHANRRYGEQVLLQVLDIVARADQDRSGEQL